MRILVVDDLPMFRNLIGTLLSRWGHEVILAEDSRQAWEYLKRDPIPMVVTDWIMPRMDGLQLCRRIRSSPLADDTYVILVTARGTKTDLVEGLKAGADDFVGKPLNQDELRARLRAGERIMRLRADLMEQNRRLEYAYSEIRGDLEAAARVQRALLPEDSTGFETIHLHWLFHLAAFVAGDIFNYFPMGDDQMAFYQLDVSGHGVRSALLSVSVSKFLAADTCRTVMGLPEVPLEQRVADLMTALNRHFQDETADMLYFTMVFGVYDRTQEQIVYCQAGHPHPRLLLPGRPLEHLGRGGFPVGMLPDAEYEGRRIEFPPGARLVLVSDGVLECESATGGPFGDEALDRLLEAGRDASLEGSLAELERAISAWRGTDAFEDDISVLALERDVTA